MSTQFQQVREIFFAALEREAAEREKYLIEACAGSSELQEQVKLLLEAHQDGTGLLDRAIQPERTIFREASLEKPGSVIGPYKLLQEIGHGGMGVVYMAEQSEPVRRKVALKIIKPGMDTRQVIARFEAERQALSLMDHPNIARVLDAGTTASGRPYFAMELVKGQPITEYCDAKHLTPRQRLELLVPVCQAIQHAHQKGIIHRDIKPSNILVAEYDQQIVPKVIDFGVAKATSTPLTEKTTFTCFGQIVGTLEYMSPEQAKVNQLDIDTRSDVYSLGVVMYELLTGSTPFDKQRLRSAAWHEMLRIIREEEPPKPSTRLSDSKGSISSISAQRQIEPGKLTNLVRGELDWIVMKALDKERSRRYETANGMARDIERYLHGEAVEAAPPTTGYRLKKLFRKHRAAVTTAAAFALLLVLGTVISVWQAVRATIAEGNAEQSLQAEATQRKLAEKARDRTRDVLDAMTSEAIGESLGTQTEISPEQRKFLSEVLTYYKEFAGEKAEDEKSRARTAQAAYRVGRIEARFERFKEAIVALQVSRKEYETLVASQPDVPLYRLELARTLHYLGFYHKDIGEFKESEDYYTESLKLEEKLVAENPTNVSYREQLANTSNNFGLLCSKLGNEFESEKNYEKACEIFSELADSLPNIQAYRKKLAITRINLGAAAQNRGQRANSETQTRQAVGLLTKLADEFPAVWEYQMHLATANANLGIALHQQNRFSEAEQPLHRALVIFEKLVDEFRSVPSYRRTLAKCCRDCGANLAKLRKFSEAEELFKKGLEIRAKLATDLPGVPAHRHSLAMCHFHFANALTEAPESQAETVEQFEKAIVIVSDLVDKFPQDREYRKVLGQIYVNLSSYQIEIGELEKGRTQLDRGTVVMEQLAGESPESVPGQVNVGLAYNNNGDASYEVGRFHESLEWFDKGIATVDPIFRGDSKNSFAKQILRACFMGRAEVKDAISDYAGAIADWDRAIELSDEKEKLRPRVGLVATRFQAGQQTEAVTEWPRY